MSADKLVPVEDFWDKFCERAASREGWALCDTGSHLRIGRIDKPADGNVKLANDAAAVWHVVEKASEGSPLHQLALQLVGPSRGCRERLVAVSLLVQVRSTVQEQPQLGQHDLLPVRQWSFDHLSDAGQVAGAALLLDVDEEPAYRLELRLQNESTLVVETYRDQWGYWLTFRLGSEEVNVAQPVDARQCLDALAQGLHELSNINCGKFICFPRRQS